jgi:hypothetical protein
MAALKDSANGHRERLAAVLALVDAGARALASQLRDPVAHDAAARARRTLRPQQAFQMLAGFRFVVIDGAAEIDFGHDCFPSERKTTSWAVVRQPDSSQSERAMPLIHVKADGGGERDKAPCRGM